MNKLTCRGCNKELENCTCNVLTTKKEQTEKLKLIGKDEMLCVSLPFRWCFDEVKDLIEASCIFQLDADQLVVNKLEAERDAAILQVGKLARELGQQDARIKELEKENEQLKKNLAGTNLALTIINSKSRHDNYPPLIVKGVAVQKDEVFIPSVTDRRV